MKNNGKNMFSDLKGAIKMKKVLGYVSPSYTGWGEKDNMYPYDMALSNGYIGGWKVTASLYADGVIKEVHSDPVQWDVTGGKTYRGIPTFGSLTELERFYRAIDTENRL